MKRIAVDLPYPNFDEVKNDFKIASVIYPSYSGTVGELNAVLQYVYHGFNFVRLKDEESADIMMGIALCEMEHLEILGKLLLKLGVDPVFTKNFCDYDFYNTRFVSYSKTPKKMLMDDMTGETVAIFSYKKMIDKIQDETVSSVISRIILDEELHINVLKERFNKINV